MIDTHIAAPHTARKLAGFAAACALILLAGWLVLPTLATAPYQPTSDDGYYLKYMREVGQRGLAAFPEQFRWYVEGQDHSQCSAQGHVCAWIFPPPSRIGFSLASAAWSRAFDVSLPALSRLSLASFLALIALQFLFARRQVGQFPAVLIAALTAFSPLYLSLSRLALTDSFITLCQVACLWLFLEVLRQPRHRAWCIAFGLAFTGAILTKEISILLVLPFATLVAIERWHAQRSLPLPLFAGLLTLPPLVALVVCLSLAGSASLLLALIKIVLFSPATNDYALRFGAGGWYRYPIDQMLVSVWPTLLGLAGGALALWRWRGGVYDRLRVYLALVYLFQVGVLSFFTKNLRYVAVLEAPLRVLAVLLVCDLAASKRVTVARLLATAVVGLLCWLDWRSFDQLFLVDRIYDPVTFALSAARGLIWVQAGPPP